MKKTLTIIIPVYNADKYLHKCLCSVFAQDFSEENYEVILVNDGSTDRSLEIAEKFAEKHKNLVILTQENKGEATARNLALEHVNSDYIGFVDADDFLLENTLDKVMQCLVKRNLDIMYLEFTHVDEEGNILEKTKPIGNQNEILPGFLHERRPYPATIYKTEIIKNTKFPLGVLVGPDSVFNAMAQTQAKRVSYCEIPFYRYTIREDSLSNKAFTEIAYQGFLKAIQILHEHKKTEFPVVTDEVRAYYERIISVFIRRIIEFHVIFHQDKNKLQELKELLDNLDYMHLLKPLSEEYKFLDKNDIYFFGNQKYQNIKSNIYKSIVKK